MHNSPINILVSSIGLPTPGNAEIEKVESRGKKHMSGFDLPGTRTGSLLESTRHCTFLGTGGGGGILYRGIGPPNRIVSKILSDSSCCVEVRSCPKRQSAFDRPTLRKYTPVIPWPGVLGLTTFARNPPMDL